MFGIICSFPKSCSPEQGTKAPVTVISEVAQACAWHLAQILKLDKQECTRTHHLKIEKGEKAGSMSINPGAAFAPLHAVATRPGTRRQLGTNACAGRSGRNAPVDGSSTTDRGRTPEGEGKAGGKSGAGRAGRKPTDWARRTHSRAHIDVRPTEDQVISRIVGCVRRKDWYSARTAYDHFTRAQVPSARLVGAYVHTLSRSHRIDDARTVLRRAPHADSAIARASVVSALAKFDGADAALNELNGLPAHLWSPHACTSVMHALGINVRPDDAAEVLTNAQRNGVLVDMGMYDAAMRALGRAGRLDDAYTMLSELRMRGLKPTDVTFEALIYACAHAQDRVEAPSVERLGRRACVVFDAAVAEELVTPRVLSAFASVVLRSHIWQDDRVDGLIEGMRDALRLGVEGLKRGGVTYERFEFKMLSLIRLRAKAVGGGDSF